MVDGWTASARDSRPGLSCGRLQEWLALVLLVTACGSGEAPSLAVDLRTDLVPHVEFDAIRVVLGDARVDHIVDRNAPWLDGVRVATFEGLPAGANTLELQVLKDGEVLLRRPTSTRLQSRVNAVTVVVTRSCLSVRCPASDAALTACLGGRCVDPGCTDDTPELCAEPECSSRGDCASMADCAEPRCSFGTCVYAAVPGACGAGESCIPEVGCRPDEVEDAGVDMGEPDASMPDADASVPDADASMPDADASVPDADASMPDADASMPDADASIPDADATVPDADCPRNEGCSVGAPGGCECDETCSPDGSGSSSCITPGTVLNNAPCVLLGENCVSGSLCVDPMVTSPRCRRVCDVASTCGPVAQWICAELISGPGVCRRRDCNLGTQNCAAAGEACYPDLARSLNACADAGSLAIGATCTIANECRQGAVCADGGGGFRCLEVCDPDGADTCSSGGCVRGPGGFWGACI